MKFCEESLEPPSDYFKTAIDRLVHKNDMQNVEIEIKRATSDGESHAGLAYKLVIKSDDKTLNFIVKTKPPFMHYVSPLLYEIEIFTYSKLLPALYALQDPLDEAEKFRYAEYFDGCLEPLNETVVLEDLTIRGFSMLDKFKCLDYEHLVLSVKNLARYHASCLVLKDKNRKLYEEAAEHSFPMEIQKFSHETLLKTGMPLIMERFQRESYGEKLKQFYESFYEKFLMHLDATTAAPYNVLCHGDAWSNNMMFKHDENNRVFDMIMIDWQMLRECSPILDFSIVIFSCSDKKLRQQHYQDIVDIYYKTLSSNVVKMGTHIEEYYPKQVFQEQLKKFMNYGLMLLTIIVPFMLADPGELNSLNDLIQGKEIKFENKIGEKRLRDIIEDCVDLGFI